MIRHAKALPLLAAALALQGCGHASTAKHAAKRPASRASTICLPAARQAMARFLTIEPSLIAAAQSVGNNAMPQCSFTARTSAGTRVAAVANVDNGPQPYFRLERTAVEASQQFASQRTIVLPSPVPRLGMDAWWFPTQVQIMTTDGLRLITVSITWPHAPQQRESALAKAVAQTYLKPRKRGPANGYPSS
jgi:hypothetical protein